MATGHLNPGYGDVVSRLRRAKSANPSLHHGHRLREMENESVDRHSLEEIRRRAREVWSQSDRNPTTYGNHFSDKTREIEPAEARPASPSRRNNPHPPLVFMSCRLHTVPGFYNPNATVGREAYKVDGSVGAEEHRQRAALKSKFINRPSTAAILQYSKPQELDVIKDPRERQATEAWLKLANDADREAVGGAIMEAYYTDEQNKAASDFSVHPPLQPSLHRFNKFAGPAERENLNDLVETYNLNRQRRPKTTIGTMRFHDIENTKRVAYVHKPKRGDFLLHPQWPPFIPHHRLNGLSSVEMPYLPGSR